jgi:TusA-related sulfurtransferase
VHASPDKGIDFFLDITREVCPLTFVRTKLLIERMEPGQTAEILLRGAEPLSNVPRAVASQGHEILELHECREAETTGVFCLRIRKKS